MCNINERLIYSDIFSFKPTEMS